MNNLQHSPAEIYRQMLVDLNLVSPALNQDWACFLNGQPDLPHNIFVVSDTAPVLNGRIQYSGRTIMRHGLSVVVRGTDPKDAWTRLHAIQRKGIDEVHRRSVIMPPSPSGNIVYRIHAVDLLNGILSLGKEPSTGDRFLFSLNALMSITVLSSGE